jgi:tRNA (guanine26-N2/guanine27-N2)-dimethyltransferase
MTTRIIQEWISKIRIPEGIFYNPVQEFNRDLSVVVIREFCKIYKSKNDKVVILDALTASGFRAIRYAQQINNMTKIIAKDMDPHAEHAIRENILFNNIPDGLIHINISDAKAFMYNQSSIQSYMDIIDLDPYGSASPFIDAAVQSISDGGLLCVTSTDMAVLAGVHPDTCYAKYGSIPIHTDYGQEMAIRILLSTIDKSANRYQRYIEPLLCLRIDFYVRLFVRVYKSQLEAKNSFSKKSMILSCRQCKTFLFHILGSHFEFPASCPICGGNFILAGPIWNRSICNESFVQSVITSLDDDSLVLNTKPRIKGMLNVLIEELDTPLYLSVSHLSKTLHCICPPLKVIKSALLNAKHQVSITHCDPLGIKTSAPISMLWDIMKEWIKGHPVKHQNDQILPHYKTAHSILSRPMIHDVDISDHPDALKSKKGPRFQINPENWGPLPRAKKSKNK